MMILAGTFGYLSMIIRTTGNASSVSSCKANMISNLGYDSLMTASSELYRLLSRPQSGRMIVIPGTAAAGKVSSLDGIDEPP